MFNSIDEIEEIVQSEDFKYVKRKVLLFDANLKMAKRMNDLKKIENKMDDFFNNLKEDERLYSIFAFNRDVLYKDLERRMGQYEQT